MRTKLIIGIVLLLAIVAPFLQSSRRPVMNAGIERAEIAVDFSAPGATSIAFTPNEGVNCRMYTDGTHGGMRIWGEDDQGTRHYEVVAREGGTSDGRVEGRIQLLTLVPVTLNVKGISNPRMEGIDGKSELPVDLPPGVYNLTITPQRPSAFVLQYRDGHDSPYTAYQVVSDEGMKRIREWMRAHDEQLQRSARLAPMMSIVPDEHFWEVRSNGVREEIPLLFSYPADFSIPKGLRSESLENLTSTDFDTLKQIFTESGVAVKPDPVP